MMQAGTRQPLTGHAARLTTGAVTIGVVLGVWELASWAGWVSASLLPPPHRVAAALLEMTRSGELGADLRTSLWRAVVGFAGGAAVGIVAGLVTGRFTTADYMLSPIGHTLRSLPPVAIVPLAILFFGIDNTAKILSIMWGVALTIWPAAHAGAREVPRSFIWAAKSMGVGPAGMLFRVVLPAASGYILAGARVACANAFILLFVAEMSGASKGIGVQISNSYQAYRIDRMLAALFVLGACGAGCDALLKYGAKWLFPWTRHGALA